MQISEREFKAWLLDPAHFRELDRGTILIPEKFLANGAVAPTPVGFAPSDLQPAFGLVAGRGRRTILCSGRADVVAALKKAAERGERLAEYPFGRGLRAPAERHQLRGLPSDPRHRRLSFPRRRLDGGQTLQFDGGAGLAAFLRRPGPPPRYPDRVPRRQAAGFLARLLQPPANCAAAPNLPAPNIEDGWGAHCYVQHANAADNDKSFKSWTCAEGLACQVTSEATRMGMCFVKSR